mmetsp:Transcript_5945/g.12609  ORF Transcript_5945/g.12609 Transcript_5945/m.12609 type:complete len:267 (+) Transcript_5945:140-940(+)
MLCPPSSSDVVGISSEPPSEAFSYVENVVPSSSNCCSSTIGGSSNSGGCEKSSSINKLDSSSSVLVADDVPEFRGPSLLPPPYAASPNKDSDDSGSGEDKSSAIIPEDATVALRSASMAESDIGTPVSVSFDVDSSPPPSPPTTASPAAPAPAPSSPPPVPPPPPNKGTPNPIPPPLGTRLAISLTIRSIGIPCNQTVPGPVKVVTNNPSPPNMTFLNPLNVVTSYSTLDVIATNEPLDTRNVSFGKSVFFTSVPYAFRNTVSSPS